MGVPTEVNFNHERGDTFGKNLEFKDSNGNAIDITGWTIFFTVKSNIDDTDDNAIIKKDVTSHTDPTNGKTVITVDASDMYPLLGLYHYDIQAKKSNGVIFTVSQGTLRIQKDITRRTS